MNDLIYTVDATKGQVECTVQNCRADFINVVNRALSQYPERIRYFYGFVAAYHCGDFIKDEYTGRAYCSDSDMFDEEYGKDLARTRAIIKREDAFMIALDKIFCDLFSMFDISHDVGVREGILDKHIENLDLLLDHGTSLAAIFGYSDKQTINNDGTLSDYTPHCCSLCNQTFLNYEDDIDYDKHESEWVHSNNFEICPRCMEAIKKLL